MIYTNSAVIFSTHVLSPTCRRRASITALAATIEPQHLIHSALSRLASKWLCANAFPNAPRRPSAPESRAGYENPAARLDRSAPPVAQSLGHSGGGAGAWL